MTIPAKISRQAKADAVVEPSTAIRRHPSIQSLGQLVKVRIAIFVSFAAGTSYNLSGGMSAAPPSRLLWLLIGTGLICLGAATLNQVLEWKWDRLMERTRARPLPAGTISRRKACAIGFCLSLFGFVVLGFEVPLISFELAGLGWVAYLAVYTPLKRLTIACIFPGALAGALPPIIGATAVEGQLCWHAYFLFALILTWQIPHLLAIAWLHGNDYEEAGFAIPCSGVFRRSKIPGLTLFSIILLVIISYIPYWTRTLGISYFVAVSIPNLIILLRGIEFMLVPEHQAARRLFTTSILYLPWIFGSLLLTQ